MMCNNCGKWAGAYAGFAKDHDLCTCPQKKEWVGLTDEERIDCEIRSEHNWVLFADIIEAKIKEKNT